MLPAHLLTEGLHALHLPLSPDIQTTLLAYLSLLEKWNRTYNLTAVRNLAEMVPKHLLDSLVVLPYIQGPQILDVGTGAGIPGLILAICHPQGQYTLLDRHAKKIRFVQQAITELGINNVEMISTRVENFRPPTPFHCIISRAYGSLKLFYQQTHALCSPDGFLLAMKGIYPEKELEEMREFSDQINVLPLHVPLLPAQRHLVVIKLANFANSSKVNVSARA